MFLVDCIRQENKRFKILNCISFGIIAAAFIFISVITFWSVYPYDPLNVKVQPFHVISKEVKAGDLLNYEIEFCKNMNITSRVSRSFVNGLLFTMPTVEGANPMGCSKNNVFLSVPKELPPGDYMLEITYVYEVNPIRDVNVKIRSEQFSVLPHDDK